MAQPKLAWQSKLILLLVVPFAAAYTLLQAHWWANQIPSVAIWTLGLSLLLGIVVLWLRAATPAAAFVGVVITASLMFSTTIYPYRPWRTVLPAVLAVSVLAFVTTRIGRNRKERMGTAESRRGRTAGQVGANLGLASLVASPFVQLWVLRFYPATVDVTVAQMLIVPTMAALAEAAADTVSSEIGQVLGGRPRMITTLRIVEPGTDGAISLWGTLAGVVAAAIVPIVVVLAFAGYNQMTLAGTGWIVGVVCASALFGLLFDSLLGATLERRGWLNNDAVNFLSTASAAAFALALLALLPEGRLH